MKNTTQQPLNGNGLVLLIKVGTTIQLKWVNSYIASLRFIGLIQASRQEWLFKNYFLFLNQNLCCGFSKEVLSTLKEPSQWDSSFDYQNKLVCPLYAVPSRLIFNCS